MPDQVKNDSMNAEEVREALKQVCDPEIGISIVDLGLVYKIDVDSVQKKCNIKMTLTSQGCPVGPQIVAAATHVAKSVTGFDSKVEVVWDPLWDPRKMATEEGKFMLGLL